MGKKTSSDWDISALKILVVGNGLMGNATVKALRSWGNSVIAYDTDPKRSDIRVDDYPDVMGDVDVVIAVVPTERKDNHHLDLSILQSVLHDFRKYAKKDAVFVQRSTTLPGTAHLLAGILEEDILDRYVVWPCFAYRATAEQDEIDPVKLVFGFEYEHLEHTVRDMLNEYVNEDRTFFGGLEEAEAAKVMSNVWQASIISMWNEISMELPSVDTDWLMATLASESNLSSIPRVHGKAFGIGGRLHDDLMAWVDKAGEGSIAQAVLNTNHVMRHYQGEHTASTKELKHRLSKALTKRQSARTKLLLEKRHG